MQNKLYNTTALFLLTCLSSSVSHATYLQQQEGKTKRDLEVQVVKLQQQVKDLKKRAARADYLEKNFDEEVNKKVEEVKRECSKKIKKLETENEELKNEIKGLKNDIQELKKEFKELKSENKELKKKNKELEGEITYLKLVTRGLTAAVGLLGGHALGLFGSSSAPCSEMDVFF